MSGDIQGLDVHDVIVNDQTLIGPGGKPVKELVVTFGIGPHSFTETLPKPANAADAATAIKQMIAQHIQLLRAVTHPEQG